MPRSKSARPQAAESKVQRYLLAGLSLLMLAAGGIAATTESLDSGSREFASGSLLKVGIVLGIVWLAAPQLQRLGWQKLRGTALAAVVVVLVLFAIRPRIGAIAGGVLVISSLLLSVAGWIRRNTKPPGRS